MSKYVASLSHELGNFNRAPTKATRHCQRQCEVTGSFLFLYSNAGVEKRPEKQEAQELRSDVSTKLVLRTPREAGLLPSTVRRPTGSGAGSSPPGRREVQPRRGSSGLPGSQKEGCAWAIIMVKAMPGTWRVCRILKHTSLLHHAWATRGFLQSRGNRFEEGNMFLCKEAELWAGDIQKQLVEWGWFV